jgi:hypothetical protein
MTTASARSFYRLSARRRAIFVLAAALALAGGAATAATAAPPYNYSPGATIVHQNLP